MKLFRKLLPLLCGALLLSACGPAAVPEPTPAPSPTPTAAPTPTPAPTATPEPTPTPEPEYVLREQVPILMYHVVAAVEDNELFLSTDNFISQLDWLAEHGYTPVTMAELYAHWAQGAWLPEKPIALTFDDGYNTMYTIVLPLLRERGLKATFYTITGSADFLSPAMLEEMAASGMEIGSHTVSHLNLTKLDLDSVYRELTDSRATLDAIPGVDAVSFCYPAGDYNDDVARAARDCGYLSAVTTQYGLASVWDDLYRLPRLRISWGMDGPALGSALAAYGLS